MPGKTAFSRRAERVRAFQALYGLGFTPHPSLADLERLFAQMPLPDADTGRELRGFAWELAEGVWKHAESLDGLITRFSRNWRLERMGRIELTILRLALFELAFCPDVPAGVAINEALDLTARFGDTKAKPFVNGILDAAVKAAGDGPLLPQPQGQSL